MKHLGNVGKCHHMICPICKQKVYRLQLILMAVIMLFYTYPVMGIKQVYTLYGFYATVSDLIELKQHLSYTRYIYF